MSGWLIETLGFCLQSYPFLPEPARTWPVIWLFFACNVSHITAQYDSFHRTISAISSRKMADMKNRLGVCRDARSVRPLKMLRAFTPTTALFVCHRLARTHQQPRCLLVINLARTHEPCVPTRLLPANHFLIGLILKFKAHTSKFKTPKLQCSMFKLQCSMFKVPPSFPSWNLSICRTFRANRTGVSSPRPLISRPKAAALSSENSPCRLVT